MEGNPKVDNSQSIEENSRELRKFEKLKIGSGLILVV